MSQGILTLPDPPSVNEAFGNNKSGSGRGRYRTQRYRTWLRAADNQALAQKRFHVSGPVVIDITCQRRSARADIDNKIKPTIDFLVSRNFIEDDRNVIEVRARWGNVDGAEVRVWSVLAEAAA